MIISETSPECLTFATPIGEHPFVKEGESGGAVAQSVEQRTENPCVGGSIPPHTTKKIRRLQQNVVVAFLSGFILYSFNKKGLDRFN